MSDDRPDRVVIVRERMVLEGRNPDWRIAWGSALSDEDRREVRLAVRRGRAVREARLSPFVFGTIARWRRWLWLIPVYGLLQLVLVAAWIYLACGVHRETVFDRFWCVFWTLTALAWLIAVPAALRFHSSRFRRAEEANRPLVEEVQAGRESPG